MTFRHLPLLLIFPIAIAACGPKARTSASPSPASASRTVAQVLDAATDADWEEIASQNLLVMALPKGRVLLELAPAFAPMHVANIVQLAHDGYFDGLAIVRTQDNYVVQWGDPNADEPAAKPLGSAKSKLPAEFVARLDTAPFTPLVDVDTYAQETGFSLGFPAAQDQAKHERWLPHCYAMVGAGRNESPDTSNGAELYVVIGQAPRHLDRNMTMVGRVVAGMDLLSSLPRGTGAMGFYRDASERTPLVTVRLASEFPSETRPRLERLRTDTATFAAYLGARRSRREPFFVEALDRLDVCNVQLPTREPQRPRQAR